MSAKKFLTFLQDDNKFLIFNHYDKLLWETFRQVKFSQNYSFLDRSARENFTGLALQQELFCNIAQSNSNKIMNQEQNLLLKKQKFAKLISQLLLLQPEVFLKQLYLKSPNLQWFRKLLEIHWLN